MKLDQVSVIVSVNDEHRLEEAHRNKDVSGVGRGFIEELLRRAVDESYESGVDYLDDSVVHTVDRDESEEKEIVSGDAVLWVAWGVPEEVERVDVEYGIYAGRTSSEFVYDDVEVVVTSK